MRAFTLGYALLVLLTSACHVTEKENSQVANAKPSDAIQTRILKIPYNPSIPGYEFIPILVTPDYTQTPSPTLGYRILCQDPADRETFLRSIGAWESYRNAQAAYSDPNFPSQEVKNLNIESQPALLCAKDRLNTPEDAGALKQDLSKPNSNFYLRFPESQIENVSGYYFQLGCEGLISGLGYDATAATSINLAAIKAEYPKTREITINCPAGKAFVVDSFVKECEAALKEGSDLGTAYQDLMRALGISSGSCSALHGRVKDEQILDLTGKDLTDLRPIQHLAKLERLVLRDNFITDLKPLGSLPQLKVLDLGNNSYLTDVTVLGDLKNLRELHLDGSSVTSLVSLRNLQELRILSIKDLVFPAAELDQLRGLLKLQTVSFDAGSIPWKATEQTFFSTCLMASSLSEPRKSSFKIILQGLGVSADFSAGAPVPKCNIAYTRARSQGTLDLTPYRTVLSGTTSTCLRPEMLLSLLEFPLRLRLNYSNCSLTQTDMSFLSQVRRVTYLDLSNNGLTSAEPLANWFGIIGPINLQGNPIQIEQCPIGMMRNRALSEYCQSIHPFVVACKTNDTRNGLGHTMAVLEEIIGMPGESCEDQHRGLNSLTNIHLRDKGITNIEPLRSLPNLVYLDLDWNKLTNVDALKGLKQLATLYVSDNQLTSLDPLRNLSNLSSLHVGSNQLTSLEPLKNLTELEHFSADLNPVKRSQETCPTDSASSALNDFCKNYLR